MRPWQIGGALLLAMVMTASVVEARSANLVPFSDGDVVFVGPNDGSACTDLCIRTERRGNTLVSSIHDRGGRTVKVVTTDLVPDAADLSEARTRALVALYRPDPSAPGEMAGAPMPPQGGTGAVTQDQNYPGQNDQGQNGTWTVATTFYFANGLLIDVEARTRFVRARKKPA